MIWSYCTSWLPGKQQQQKQQQAKLVGVDDFLTQVIWTRYFLKEQGYKIHNNIIYQDNQSAIKLEKNGRLSISKQNCHINIRYYFITYRITEQEAYV